MGGDQFFSEITKIFEFCNPVMLVGKVHPLGTPINFVLKLQNPFEF